MWTHTYRGADPAVEARLDARRKPERETHENWCVCESCVVAHDGTLAQAVDDLLLALHLRRLHWDVTGSGHTTIRGDEILRLRRALDPVVKRTP